MKKWMKNVVIGGLTLGALGVAVPMASGLSLTTLLPIGNLSSPVPSISLPVPIGGLTVPNLPTLVGLPPINLNLPVGDLSIPVGLYAYLQGSSGAQGYVTWTTGLQTHSVVIEMAKNLNVFGSFPSPGDIAVSSGPGVAGFEQTCNVLGPCTYVTFEHSVPSSSLQVNPLLSSASLNVTLSGCAINIAAASNATPVIAESNYHYGSGPGLPYNLNMNLGLSIVRSPISLSGSVCGVTIPASAQVSGSIYDSLQNISEAQVSS